MGSALACFNSRRDDLKSFILGRSHCDSCGKQLKAFENIPILSFLLLKGKCSSCKAKIDITYFLYELLAAIFFVLFYIRKGISFEFILCCIQTLLLINISFCDLKNMEVKTSDLYFLVIVSFIHGIKYNFKISLIVASVFAIIYILLNRLSLMGEADIYMGIANGLCSNTFTKALLSLQITFISAAIYGILMMIFFNKNKNSKIPFCPFISLGIVSVIL